MPLAGLTPNLTAPTVDGDVVDVGRCFLMVDNASGAAVTVTVVTPETVDGLAITDRAVSVAAGGVGFVPLTSPHYRQTVGSAAQAADVGRAYVNYSAEASVTRGVISL
jgi:hypothetical protein